MSHAQGIRRFLAPYPQTTLIPRDRFQEKEAHGLRGELVRCDGEPARIALPAIGHPL
jgi:hypothetical protein